MEQFHCIAIWDNSGRFSPSCINTQLVRRLSQVFRSIPNSEFHPPQTHWGVLLRTALEGIQYDMTMEEDYGEIALEFIQGRLIHSRAYFLNCPGRAKVTCDMSEVMWLDPDQSQDAENEDADIDG